MGAFARTLVAWHEADIDQGLLEPRARARDVIASQLKAAAAIGQVWLVEAARCVRHSYRPRDQVGKAPRIDE